MFAILFMIANFFATLFLVIALIGNIQSHKLQINMQMILSILISISFIFLITCIGLLHPLFFAFWGMLTAGSLLFLFRADNQDWAYNILLAITTWAFWPQMVAFISFQMMFVEQTEPSEKD
jgi:hypothetical protein